MPAHGLPPDEHRRRIEAVCQALAEGCTPPSVHVRYGGKRAKARALEILNAGSARPLSPAAWDSYFHDNPFPWPAPGEKPKLTREFLARVGLEPKAEPPAPVEGIELSPQQTQPHQPADGVEMRRLRGRISDLERKLKAAEETAIAAQDAHALALDLGAVKLSAPEWLMEADTPSGQPGVPFLCLNDWHCGEIVRAAEIDGLNSYDLDTAEQRIQRVIQRTIDLCYSHTPGPGGARPDYPGIVVGCLGDMVSGDIHDELRETNEVSRNVSMLWTAERLVAAIRALADAFGRAHVIGVPGNHGRDGRPRAKLICHTNADWVIYQLAAKDTRGDPRITWQIPDSGDAHVRVAGVDYFVTHGDRLGVKGGDGIIGALGPIIRGDVKISRQQAHVGRAYDTLVIGHFHQYVPLSRVMVSNCLIGANEYGLNILRAPPSAPSQALWFTHPHWGITARWEVFCDDAMRRPWSETPCLKR